MFYYTEIFHMQTENVKSVIIDYSIHELKELFERFRVSLQIPYTTMTNFCAFRDVMEELEWIPENEIRIYHDSLPSLKEDEMACYIDFLNLIDVEWEKYEERANIIRNYMKKTGRPIPENAWINTPPKMFNVYFKKKDEDMIKHILEKHSKNFRKCIRYDEKGGEYIIEDDHGKDRAKGGSSYTRRVITCLKKIIKMTK